MHNCTPPQTVVRVFLESLQQYQIMGQLGVVEAIFRVILSSMKETKAPESCWICYLVNNANSAILTSTMISLAIE